MTRNKILNQKIYLEHTRTNKIPEINDVWLAYYPYMEKGNMEKARPVLIIEEKENGNYLVRKITSNKKKGILINDLKNYKKSYLTNDYAEISFEKMIRRLKSHNDKN